MTDLATESCRDGAPALGGDEAQALLARVEGWAMDADGATIRRRFGFKGFARAVEMANLAAWLGNKQNHHPDISFGWGYCEVAFTTHDAGGLTRNDFICAARLNALVA
ncbi:MAG: 4a-hydroxytetrahydrobiopterin dehydratase [Paracoccus sp. (in: a-proteobacteria)]|uniref:4a-hydroxytetrahydrobiopterin dehydratase n=1 Tax=Paracoccus sp. TaxID=267 RepID=UPI0026E009EC|nr:4a-hydroxytetrahydrobiopterin dehydratase [Paracoccus sp. (in: a-proteobacteria)]MDO5632301.1 4a-hydroxytetrahydrobiopterin dehydratase [Paracoccus sp. (in: a-proteobacteria)]